MFSNTLIFPFVSYGPPPYNTYYGPYAPIKGKVSPQL